MIGIFDSGVGGMTVARAVEKILPQNRLVYFGDLARTPYGSKSQETIIDYARENTEFLISKGAKLIIIACNSVASVAADLLRQEFAVPVFEVIEPAIDKALAATATARIGVIGTRATIRSGVYEKKIKHRNKDAEVFSQACPLLVPLVEEGWLTRRETRMIVKHYLYPLKNRQVDTLVLGCTHYPLLKNIIQPRVGKRVNVIDSAEEVAAGLKTFLDRTPEIADSLTRDGEKYFYVSDVTPAAESTAQRIFGRQIRLIKER